MPCPDENVASIIYNVCKVDQELKPDKISRLFSVSGSVLCIEFISDNLKTLRVASKSFLEKIQLTVDTIEKFKQ